MKAAAVSRESLEFNVLATSQSQMAISLTRSLEAEWFGTAQKTLAYGSAIAILRMDHPAMRQLSSGLLQTRIR